VPDERFIERTSSSNVRLLQAAVHSLTAMTVLRFSDGPNFFEMSVAIEEGRTVQSFGDAYVMLKIESKGFSGHNDLWVPGADLAKFCNALLVLERELKGAAELQSTSPNELERKVMAVTSRGHVAVAGSTGYDVRLENCNQWHSVAFGFEFEQRQLSEAVATPWVRRYSG
jgi:hypothetical protein